MVAFRRGSVPALQGCQTRSPSGGPPDGNLPHPCRFRVGERLPVLPHLAAGILPGRIPPRRDPAGSPRTLVSAPSQRRDLRLPRPAPRRGLRSGAVVHALPLGAHLPTRGQRESALLHPAGTGKEAALPEPSRHRPARCPSRRPGDQGRRHRLRPHRREPLQRQPAPRRLPQRTFHWGESARRGATPVLLPGMFPQRCRPHAGRPHRRGNPPQPRSGSGRRSHRRATARAEAYAGSCTTEGGACREPSRPARLGAQQPPHSDRLFPRRHHPRHRKLGWHHPFLEPHHRPTPHHPHRPHQQGDRPHL